MPPRDTGISLAISAKQLIVGVISISGTVIGLVWLVMNSYLTRTDHVQFETTLTSVDAYATQDKLDAKDTNLLLSTIQKKQDENYDKLSNEIAKSQQAQLTLRRNILTFDKDKLSKREKNELKKIEELMVMEGYLNPDLLTKF